MGSLRDTTGHRGTSTTKFFPNQNNPTNFERTWNTAYFLYRRIGAVGERVPFDQVMDFSVIQKLASEPRYANQRNEYQVRFAPSTASTIQAESAEILTKTVVIQFYPNSWDIERMITRTVDGQTIEELYDPNASFVIEEVGTLAGQYGAARVIIEGHTDASMRGRVPASLVQELSFNRANAVKEGILRRFGSLDANQFTTAGFGWDTPAEENDADNHAKNRRVEVKVYPAEAGG